ncbi:MAG TPA: UDP-glucose 4-epimerase GalE [Luteimonas sp.]|nr:UDP-glucose 4-epimerase GalE [Luteimonas sp.]
MKILVCGGAGYIGSHMVRRLAADGHEPVVYDNLSTGHAEAIGDAALIHADLLDAGALQQAFTAHAFDAVMHFCASSLVAESVADPYAYYANNVGGTLALLSAMRAGGADMLVFSSTAAVYGWPQAETIDEDHPTVPINPYGKSKLMAETILADAASAYGLRSVALRYFNAAGASADGRHGEAHRPETHLIPNALRAAAGTGPELTVHGDDYATPDGSCVRDFVHVSDLAKAHLLALEYLQRHSGAHTFNLGNGRGFSVLEVVAAAAQVTGRAVPYRVAGRRPGDPDRLVASGRKAERELGWRPRHVDIAAIVASAWQWHRAQEY